LPEWENEGWIGVKGATYIRALVNQLRQRTAPTTFKKAGSEDERTKIALSRTKRNMALTVGPPTPLRPVEKAAFKLTGAKLQHLSQALAYQGIRERAAPPPRTTTTTTVMEIRRHLNSIPGTDVDEEDIWRGIRHHDLRRAVVDFLWKGIHGAHRVGTFWLKIPGYEDRALCTHCAVRDSMSHILINCAAPGQSRVWELAKAAWEKKGEKWNPPQINDILGIGPRSRRLREGEATPGHTARFWRILISECAHLIWKLRCERVVGHSDAEDWQHTDNSITSRWYSMLNSRLRQDTEGTNKRYGRLALKKGSVIRTWEHILENEQNLPTDWTI
ncbi:hypothetical protein FOMPIDRAFT_8188, partial [Fomitopsis schrenkii]